MQNNAPDLGLERFGYEEVEKTILVNGQWHTVMVKVLNNQGRGVRVVRDPNPKVPGRMFGKRKK